MHRLHKDTSLTRSSRRFVGTFRHGLTGTFRMLEKENQEEFDELYAGLRAERRQGTPTEILLVESMAQHYWLMQRAMRLQTLCFDTIAGSGIFRRLAYGYRLPLDAVLAHACVRLLARGSAAK